MTRRTRGDGALSQRHDHVACPPLIDGKRAPHRCKGRWAGRAVVIERGKKVRRTVYGRTQKAAKIKLDTMIEQAKSGPVITSSHKLEAWAEDWLDDIVPRDRKPGTVREYRLKVRTQILPHLGQLRLDRIEPAHIRRWHDTLTKRGSAKGGPLAPATVLGAHLVLQAMLKDAVFEGILRETPMARVSPPKAPRREGEAFTLDEVALILQAAGMNARWRLAVMYGMRQGEVLGLRWCDIDFDLPILTVNQTMQRDADGATIFGPPKTKRSQREIPLLPWMHLPLAAHKPVGVDEAELVFPVRNARADNQAWHDLLDRAGVRHLSLHSARHSAASVLEAAEVPDRLIMQILGHSQVRMTHHYTHAERARVSQALAAAGDLFPTLAIEE